MDIDQLSGMIASVEKALVSYQSAKTTIERTYPDKNVRPKSVGLALGELAGLISYTRERLQALRSLLRKLEGRPRPPQSDAQSDGPEPSSL